MATSRAIKANRAPSCIEVSTTTATEMQAVATAVGRSIAFVVERALAARTTTTAANGVMPSDRVELTLTVDEDDPADLRARIQKRVGAAALDVAIEAAWLATRARFLAWAERERVARLAECADDLDTALAAAAAAATTTEALATLGASSYPRVRALVAAHANTAAATLALLGRDREPYVRDAVANRSLRFA